MKKKSNGLYMLTSIEKDLKELIGGFSFYDEEIVNKHIRLKNIHSHLNRNIEKYYETYQNPTKIIKESYFNIAKMYLRILRFTDLNTQFLLMSDTLEIRNNEFIKNDKNYSNELDKNLLDAYSNLSDNILENNKKYKYANMLRTGKMDFETPFCFYHKKIEILKNSNTTRDKYLISEEYKKLYELYDIRYKNYMTNCKELEAERNLIKKQSIEYYKKSIELKKELLVSDSCNEHIVIKGIIEDCEEGIKLFPKNTNKLYFLNTLLELSLLSMENALIADISSIDLFEVKNKISKSLVSLYSIKNGENKVIDEEQLEIINKVLENLEKSRDISKVDPRFTNIKEYIIA